MSGGKIVKVSGPLVIASDLTDVRMYDVVKVGLPQLIGEVIGLDGNTAFIQVYEETAGIGPDEPVISTGEPLSVELGPGLIGGIYDGIQRPLTVIQKMSGNWIARGIDILKLDRKKKWAFKAKVNKGDQIIAGDIIGTVQETELVEQKIMVPPGLAGEVIMIKSGDFTVEEVVCQVKQNGQSTDIKMSQHWPVRRMRPVKEKLPPIEPLVTGQRVIDTFFPVAKGGTACIPGPFGSGKCVTGDTPVLLADGRLELIREIYEKNKNRGEKTVSDTEEYTILDRPLEVFTYQNGKISRQKVSAVYKGKTDRILMIKTRTGRVAKVTPIHKLFKINGCLEIVEQEAWKLKKGDYLVSPRWLDFSGKMQIFDENPLNQSYRIKQQRLGNSLRSLIDNNLSKFGTKKNMARTLGISYDVFIEYYLGRNNPTVDFVNKLSALTGGKRFSIDKIKGQRQSKEVRLPKQLTKDIAMFFGLVLGDGMVKKNSVRFYNNEKAILDYYSNLSRKIFEVSTKRVQTRTAKMELIESNIIANFLRQNGYPEYKKSRNCFMPHKLLLSPVEVIGAFLGAYFICDGYINSKKGEIEITTASRNMARDLLYLWLRLGILARLREKTYKGSTYYRILISGRAEIEKFYRLSNIFDCEKLKKVGAFLSSDKKEGANIDIIPISPETVAAFYNEKNRPYQILKNNGLEIHNYLNLQKELMTRRTFRIFTKAIGSDRLGEMADNHFEHLFCDRIEKIEEIPVQQEVYDLEVPEGHNFVGGIAPMFFHNTVVQHQLAKWADAQIIVYVGCGERGNEMTDVLMEFPKLKDPRSGEPLIKRTVLIANTSNMPVSAREASVYTGITIAEYFRDMGYTVALMADSTSRWAEALREMSGRLEEMPGEEGYPAYLSMRIAEFYERAGRVKCACNGEREGSLSVIGAVSPPGGDLSDPVVQGTLRVVKVFWSLEDKLAYMRHFPAINWLNSYSLYLDNISEYVGKKIGPDFLALRRKAIKLLQDEASLEEIVRLVGVESLSPNDRLTLATAKSIREDFLHQMAFDPEDTYTSLQKQHQLLKLIMHFHQLAKEAIGHSQNLDEILKYKVREKIAKAKYIPEDKIDSFNELFKEIEKVFKPL